MRASEVAVIGLAPHSGWAAAVVLGGRSTSPRVLARRRIEMSDPADPESKQPYHTVEDFEIEEAAQRLNSYMNSATSLALAATQALIEEMWNRDHRVESMGILDSSGRKGGSLASILASHALIHTADGDHFRQALTSSGERSGLSVSRVRARDLEGEAETRLRQKAARIRETVKEWGLEVGPPWGADQKMAALIAWLLLPR